eukprot:3008227-Lingulodinium_polyedra.AAC.1
MATGAADAEPRLGPPQPSPRNARAASCCNAWPRWAGDVTLVSPATTEFVLRAGGLDRPRVPVGSRAGDGRRVGSGLRGSNTHPMLRAGDGGP